MKKTLVFLAGLFLLQVGFSQDIIKPIEKKSAIIISGGPSFPMGSFASTTSDEAGMAGTGYNVNLNYVYSVKSLGLVVHGMYVNHSAKVPETIMGSGIDMGNWKYSAVTAGVLNSFNAGSKGKLDLRVLAGVAFVNSPEISYSLEGNTGVVPSINSTTFMGELGAGYRLLFNETTFLYAGVDWIYMKPRFKDTNVYPEPMEQKISGLNVNLGIGFRF